jgi:hypothetical protein
VLEAGAAEAHAEAPPASDRGLPAIGDFVLEEGFWETAKISDALCSNTDTTFICLCLPPGAVSHSPASTATLTSSCC